jgi:hypothetical protein
MPPIKKVFLFIVLVLFFYCLFSFIAIKTEYGFLQFRNVNLLSDVISTGEKKNEIAFADSVQKNLVKDSVTAPSEPESYQFKNYQYPGYITGFQRDTLAPSLNRLNAKLLAFKQGKNVKIRIAYLGDSMIEDDLLTQTLRKLLQRFFGGYGVGFVPVTSHVSNSRITASADFSDNWRDDNFKTASASNKQTLFFSGHTYYGDNSWVTINDNTARNTLLEKCLLCGRSDNNTIEYNDKPFSVNALNNFNRILLSTDYSSKAKISVRDDNFPVYGISFESPSGVIVDNFSFRGMSGVELNAINPAFLKAIDQNNPYDLIILGYGINVLYKPNDVNFDWYKKLLSPVLKKFKQNFPNSDIVVVSTADRAFRYNGEYKSSRGIDSLVTMQARLAFDNNVCFYNQFITMGGENSIVKWANETPALASKDYIHPNTRGAEILATHFFNAIVNDYNKYIATTSTANKTN